MRKMYKLIISLMVMSILISPVIAIENQSIKKPVTYRVLVDQNYGFYRIYEMHDKLLGEDIYSENGTLNISKGGTVIFINSAISDNVLTIISDENLWNDEDGILKYSGKEFSYTFDNAGIYNIYIKERPLLKQKIIVCPMDIGTTGKTDTNDTISNLTNDTISNLTNDTISNLTNDTESDQTNITETNSVTQNLTNITETNLTNITETNLTNITETNLTNITETNSVTQNLTNITETNFVEKSDRNNTTVVKQNSILGISNTFVRTFILLVMLTLSVIYFLSTRTKEE